MKQIHIRLNEDKTAEIRLGDGLPKTAILDGCYRAEVVRVPEQLFEYLPGYVQECKENSGIDLPALGKNNPKDI